MPASTSNPLRPSNDTVNRAYVAEIKTTLRQDGIEQLLELFPKFFPAHRVRAHREERGR